MPAGTLRRVPLKFAGWTGVEVPLEAAIVKRTDTDDHLSRAYSRTGGIGRVDVFIGYGVRARDLQPHRPDICYTSAGWTLRTARTVELTRADGADWPARLYHFGRGGFDERQVVVLAYYIIDGQYAADVAALRSKAWRGSAGVRYVLQVQVAASGYEPGPLEQIVRDFASESAGLIDAQLPELPSAAPPRSK